ncbi:alpha/beta hydrolase fold domain-containing protein [Wenyingzhuangia sp. 2_MG-2023]|uniref:alpha/beta hydrolase fold domain-containing protein n=1 Tax=Wenyingzhuangia sp. 2_MG-2023 TaxID=3062639 RepID=UPI0026E171AB|nr:alpha/beta hydrolase fold domain-containing protein [Wenyingzhuangia sp. 2_MG-2023]MDO6737766.1 alpha/beta hydrolase fold domain-containing protein [Wenyingzhuangia sp. 2_MG-2023]
MKTQLLYLIALIFTVTSFSQSNSCGEIVNNTFDDGTISSNGWVEYNTFGRVTVETGKLKFNHNTTKPSAYHTFSPVASNSVFSFDVATSRNSVNCQIHLISSTGKYLSSIAVGVKTASIKYATTMSAGVPSNFTSGVSGLSLETNTNYTISTKIDFTLKKVSFYINGELMGADIPFLENVKDIAKIDIQSIYMYSNNGQFYFDNLSLVKGDENRLLLTTDVTNAESLIYSASIGNEYNEYPQTAIDVFQQAIDNTNFILTNCESDSNTIDSAIANLHTAQEEFTEARITSLIFSLKNNIGIIEDELGSVIRWENQIDGYGDATQSNSSLGGEQLQETYPGKVTVGFNKEGSYLELEGTNTAVSDNTFSFFYVGKANPTNRIASLIGNYDIDGAWDKISGIRIVKLTDGSVKLQYGTPGLKIVTLGSIPGDGYFFIGFSMDASGNYTYFDSSSPIIKEGTLSAAILQNNANFQLNLFDDIHGPKTYDHTEVVELSLYKETLTTIDFKNEFTRLSTEYPELVKGEFSVTETLPSERTNLSVNSNITVVCDQAIESSSVFPKIYIDKNETEVAGNWVLSPSNTLTFTPSENWPHNALVTVKIEEELTSTDGVSIDTSKGTTYNYIVETDKNYGESENIVFTSIATVDFPQVGHTLGLKMNLPTHREHKVPVHFWIHGGGWSGGTVAASAGDFSPHGEYLAENLGIATLGIGYRCSGSSGTFTLAMEDVATAYQWALDNADTYNFDMTKVFFSGGSAGTPLAALSSQRLANVIGFIGFNGIYDFVNDAGDFGTGNSYKQNVPSEEANSPIFQLSSTPPATIMMHGDADTTISYTQSTLFADAINSHGGSAETVIYPGEVHAFFNKGKSAYEDVLIEMVNFMSKTLTAEESLSVETLYKKGKLIAYPNPVQQGDFLNIFLNSNFKNKEVEVQIINLLGQVVLTSTMQPKDESNQLYINTKNYKKGGYILKLVINSIAETQKIIIQ